MNLYKKEYFLKNDFLLLALENLKKPIPHVNENWRSVMNTTYNLVSNLTREKSMKSILSSSCLFYNYWETIDALLPEMNFKRFVIIVVNDMLTGVWKAKSILGKRVVPKLKRGDLHYKNQFLYDEIMKHVHLTLSNDTYYYVYSLNYERYHDVFITYFEYKMIADYSKVVFYFVNISNYSTRDEVNSIRPDSVIPALPENCHLFTTNCRNRFLKPIYLISLHQEFHRHYPKYFSEYATFYNSLTEFKNDHHSHYKGNNSTEYAQKFYDFLKGQQISYDTDYLFQDLLCSSLRELNKRINIDFNMTELGNFSYIFNLLQNAHKNVTSINIADNDNLKYFCMNSNILQFIKFFCFLEINYIEGMLKFIDTKSDYVNNMAKIVENEKNVVIEYLSKTLKWINEILLYERNKRILGKSNVSYSEVPKIISNGADSLRSCYSVVTCPIYLTMEKLYTE
ncbi:uncharacterized protein LOC122501231 [Leptopilina heterotoma]|uniref:uncharacterized protein LOC122501231 n=1 Tax=Leptopilina heterotoma TaxID=63436 RepID=UPI001CA88172|nr:uncharacterized protein LOC122501231 [Leptopilina heterotoma]